MSADEKDATMADFKRGEIDVLVSTTVIEVGVDVPTPTSWSSSTPSASGCRNCISCADASDAAAPSRIAC